MFDGQPSPPDLIKETAKQKKPHPGWANLIPAKKGEVRNPRGRPKKDLDLAALAQKHAEKAVETLAKCLTDTTATWPAKVSAASELLDRGFGKAPQHGSINVELGFSKQFEDFIRELTQKTTPKTIEHENDVSDGVVIPLEPRREAAE